MPTLVERLSDRTSGEAIGIATNRPAYRSCRSSGRPPVSRPNTSTTPSDTPSGASQSVRVAFVEKNHGSPSEGSWLSSASQLGHVRRSTCSH